MQADLRVTSYNNNSNKSSNNFSECVESIQLTIDKGEKEANKGDCEKQNGSIDAVKNVSAELSFAQIFPHTWGEEQYESIT